MLVTVAMEVKLQTLPKQVAGVLARRIATGGISGRIGPSEQQILQEFGVSRAVAREALKILAALDIVEIAQGRRVVLRPADEWDYLSPLLIDWLPQEQIRELLAEAHATRLIIEPAIAAIAAKHMTEENLTHLGTLLTAMSANEHDPDAYLKLDLDFHMEICRAAGNRILDRFMYSSRWWQTASRRDQQPGPGRSAIGYRDASRDLRGAGCARPKARARGHALAFEVDDRCRTP